RQHRLQPLLRQTVSEQVALLSEKLGDYHLIHLVLRQDHVLWLGRMLRIASHAFSLCHLTPSYASLDPVTASVAPSFSIAVVFSVTRLRTHSAQHCPGPSSSTRSPFSMLVGFENSTPAGAVVSSAMVSACGSVSSAGTTPVGSN